MVWNFLKLKTENSFKSLQDNLRAIVGFIEKHWVPILIIFSITTILYFLGHIINFLADLWYPYDIELKEIKNQELYISIIKAKNENVLKIFAAITALGLAIWRLIIADKNRKIADENHKISKKQEINERYAKAIELLGHKSEAVRIGALYTLEQLSKENEEYFNTCLEAISGYIRHESNCSTRMRESLANWIKEYQVYEKSIKPKNYAAQIEDIANDQTPKRDLPEDIKTAVNILSRHKSKDKHNLKNINWMGIDLYTASIEFNNINFSHSKFQNIIFYSHIKLSTCNLYGTNLTNAYLRGAELKGTELKKVNLTKAYLEGADLKGIKLYESNLQGADLQGAELQGAHFFGTTLKKTNLEGASLDKKTFSSLKNHLTGWVFYDDEELDENIGLLTEAPEEPESKNDKKEEGSNKENDEKLQKEAENHLYLEEFLKEQEQ